LINNLKLAVLFSVPAAADPQDRSFPNEVKIITITVSRSATQAAASSSSRSLWDMYKMGHIVDRENLDVMFYPSVYTFFPVFSSIKSIVAIHDAIPEIYPDMIFPNLRAKLLWKMKIWIAMHQSNLILTVSEYSKTTLKKYLNIKPENIIVTCEAADETFEKKSANGKFTSIIKKYGLSKQSHYFLYVGGMDPHKNLSTLVDAFRRLKKQIDLACLKLVIVGDYSNDVFWMDSEIQKLASEKDIRNVILFTGYVLDEELPYLYSGSEALVIPSYCEGFGLPAVEAMSCGTPVIGSQTTSLPEIVKDAGLFRSNQS